MSSETSLEHNYGQKLSKPLHVQYVEHALQLEPLMTYVENLIIQPRDSANESTDGESDILCLSAKDGEGNKYINGITISKAERKADKTRLYNFTKMKKSRRWLKNILLSDSSSDDEDEQPISSEDLHTMLKVHKYQRKHQLQFYQNAELHQYQYYSTGMLSNYDKFSEHQKQVLGPKKKTFREHKKLDRKMKAKLRKMKREKKLENGDEGSGEIDPAVLEAILHHRHQSSKGHRNKKLTPDQADARRKKIWISISKKEIPKAQKQKASARKEMLSTLKKISYQCMRECRRAAVHSQKVMKETPQRAKRLTREMLMYWKRFEKVEKEHRKRAEKEAQEQRKMDLELREAKRQQRKLNFLITQTELYAHFMARKLTGETNVARDKILNKLDEKSSLKQHQVEGGLLVDVDEDDYDCDDAKQLALTTAEQAFKSHQAKGHKFDNGHGLSLSGSAVTNALNSGFSNPSLSTATDRPQPAMFVGKLKCYQLKGMNWLGDLYDQGINGILADEMGLGKTVQSIALLAHLAETQNIWGPFLVIAPASTLHNWQQECERFAPRFKSVPYWGNPQDRRILRKFWDQKCLHMESASFHIVITSYQLVIQDVKYFQRVKWQYMILDEAQAIKSSASNRWKVLLGFNCRNRLLLSGTPIQNTMAELWALLHFIMPTLFDSHDEFNEWFSKDIESHVEKQSGIDENQLSRLHMILKPFMLRRVKKDVENELSDKIEILVYCPLTTRQRLLYQAVKNKISIEDLLNTSTATSATQAQNTTSSLMNLVMQFRKVCNHPELFERREVKSPFHMTLGPYYVPKLIFREGVQSNVELSQRHIIYNRLYLHSADNIHHSLFSSSRTSTSVDSGYSFLRFVDVSPAEMTAHMLGGLLVRWLAVFLWLKSAYRIHHANEWSIPARNRRYLTNRCLLLEPLQTLSPANLTISPNLQRLVFVTPGSTIYTHQSHLVHYIKETTWHRQVRLKHTRQAPVTRKSPKNPISPPHSPPVGHQKLMLDADPDVDYPSHPHRLRSPRRLTLQPTRLPNFLFCPLNKVQTPYCDHYTVDRSAEWGRMRERLCGTLDAQKSVLYGTPDIYSELRLSPLRFYHVSPGGLCLSRPQYGWSGIQVPDKETLVTDAGKLTVLDGLLQRLKIDGHRILIYSQMTRMIDLLEEYMWHRKHTYMRLDGSSKISDRRDMVADFQTRSDIFVFLLSTRAGGLGINLTAADTVIFYDSDWNPTVDQQAMDRAHRLGQTKQVTVYRLICKGSIEERILQRAKEKSEIQRMVISGGNFRPDSLKPREVVSLLIDDDEMEKRLTVRQEDKHWKEDGHREKDKKRKREKYADKQKSGKKMKVEDVNVTIPAVDTESVASMDSMSVPASPQSEISIGSEQQSGSLAVDDSSNDALVIVDDGSFSSVTPSITPPPKRGSGRGRGRPKGSGTGRRPRGRGNSKKALSAAEIAGAQAGMTAAYAAYGYNFQGVSGGRGGGTPTQTGAAPPMESKSELVSPIQNKDAVQ